MHKHSVQCVLQFDPYGLLSKYLLWNVTVNIHTLREFHAR